MVFLHQHQERKWLQSDFAIALAFNLATWILVGILAVVVID